jgi:hypothetical protein
MKCNKEELRPLGATPRGPRKNQRPGGTHRPHPPGGMFYAALNNNAVESRIVRLFIND